MNFCKYSLYLDWTSHVTFRLALPTPSVILLDDFLMPSSLGMPEIHSPGLCITVLIASWILWCHILVRILYIHFASKTNLEFSFPNLAFTSNLPKPHEVTLTGIYSKIAWTICVRRNEPVLKPWLPQSHWGLSLGDYHLNDLFFCWTFLAGSWPYVYIWGLHQFHYFHFC